MVTTVRAITQELDNFASEYATAIEHIYVDNRPLAEEIAAALEHWRAHGKLEAELVQPEAFAPSGYGS